MEKTHNALYFSRAHPAPGCPCHLEVLPGELTVRVAESFETVPLERLSVKSGGFDHDHLILSWTTDGDERQIYVKDPVVIASLATLTSPEVSRHIASRARQATKMWIGFTMASLMAVLVGLWATSDVLVQMAVRRIP